LRGLQNPLLERGARLRGASIPTEAPLRAPSTTWQVTDTKATINCGSVTVTLKKINGEWY